MEEPKISFSLRRSIVASVSHVRNTGNGVLGEVLGCRRRRSVEYKNLLMRLENELLFGTISDVEYGSVSLETQGRARELEDRLGQLSAEAHASMAGVATAAAEFDELGGWCDGGIRSFEHWLSIAMGFDPHTGKGLLRVRQAPR